MTKIILSFAMLCAPALAGSSSPELKSDKDKLLYSIGYILNDQLYVFDLAKEDMPLVEKGFSDALNKREAKAKPEDYQDKISDFARERWEARIKRTKADSAAFLEKAAAEKGAVIISSGILYNEIKAGTGAVPVSTDTVKVYYKGTLPDGKVFDSNMGKEPLAFQLDHVIPCWTTGVAKMKVGGKARLVCPSDTAYGDDGHPPAIPGGSALVFEVELLDIVRK